MQRRELLKALIGAPAAGAVLATTCAATNTPEAVDDYLGEPDCSGLLPLRAGELHFLLGRPCNGKTTLAMSIALDFVEAGKGEVWFFSLSKQSQQIAKCMGLIAKSLTQVNDGSHFMHLRQRAYQAVSQRGPESLYLFDDWYGTYYDLPSIVDCLGTLHGHKPALVIYDADCFDYTKLTNEEENSLAADLQQRRHECASLYKAPIIVTLGMPSCGGVDRPDKTPILSDIKPRKGSALIDELYFVYRPAIYADTLDGPDNILLTRCNRARPENVSKMLVADVGTRRLRQIP